MIPQKDSRILKLLDNLERIGYPVLTSKGTPFEWKEHNFLLEPLCDFHPRQGINKCSQVGWTETAWLKAWYMAKYLGLNVLYTFPTDAFVRDVVPPKVDKIIDNNQHIFSDISGGIYQKQVGTGPTARFIYFKGAHNPKSETSREESSKGTSITSDINIHDEASKSDQFILNQMMSRYSDSKYQGRWLFDNPTYPKMGADSYYHRSDQKHWFIKCPHCGHKQYLDWVRLDQHEHKKALHTYIDVDKKKIICGKCAKPIEGEARRNGEWIAKYRDRTDIRGYWVNQLMYVRHSVASLLEVQEDPKVSTAYFHNFVMGKPYIGADVKISRQHMTQNMSLDINPMVDNAMGIDQGRVKWYVIGNEKGIFHVGKTESWDEIERLIRQYNVTTVSDGLPEQQKPKEFASKYKGRFWRAFYKPTSDQSELAKFVPEKDYAVLIQRNETFDEIVDRIVTGRFPMQLNPNDVPEFIEHWTNMVRITQEDKEGNQRFDWVETDADHFAHATLYWWIAMMRRGGGLVASKASRQGDQGKPAITVAAEGGTLNEDLLKSFTKGRR